jgi:hypothetical protein
MWGPVPHVLHSTYRVTQVGGMSHVVGGKVVSHMPHSTYYLPDEWYTLPSAR